MFVLQSKSTKQYVKITEDDRGFYYWNLFNNLESASKFSSSKEALFFARDLTILGCDIVNIKELI